MGVILEFKAKAKKIPFPIPGQELNGFKCGDNVFWRGQAGRIILIDLAEGELFPILVRFNDGRCVSFTSTGFCPRINDEQLTAIGDASE